MLSRRQFLLATAGTLTPGFVLPNFLEKAVSYLETYDRPLLLPPENPEHILYASHNEEGSYYLFLDEPTLQPPRFTWRQFMEHYFGSVEEYLGIDHISEAGEVWREDLDAEAEFETVLDCYMRRESPEARAFYLLEPLNLGLGGNHPDAMGELEFIDGPMPGSLYLAVYAQDRLTLSILQHELNRLGQSVRVEIENL